MNSDADIIKRTIEDLALFGGLPAFRAPVHVGCPNIGKKEYFLEHVDEIFARRWFTNGGQVVNEFEKKCAEFLGVRHCIAMCNGTVAMEIAIRALGLTGEVVVPSFTFIATTHAVQWQGITPVFCDIDPRTHHIDPNLIERLITSRTSGIIGVHLWGLPCDIERLEEIALRRGLALIFDAAHAFGCSYKGKMIGNFGSTEIMSFHATKFFNTFEGGAVVTNDNDVARRVRLMKNFGFEGIDNVTFIGTNGKMTEICAAMGLTSFESLDDFISINQQNRSAYMQALDPLSGIHVLCDSELKERRNYQYVVTEVDEDDAGLTRDQLVRILHAENVLVRRYFYPGCHRMEPYRSLPAYKNLSLENTESVAERVMSLPTGTSVDLATIAKICTLIRFALSRADEIRERLDEL